jgi:hypothetical protein
MGTDRIVNSVAIDEVVAAPNHKNHKERIEMQWLESAKAWSLRFVEVGAGLVATIVILQLLFGANPLFLSDAINGIVAMAAGSGMEGLVALLALGSAIYLLKRL